MNAVSPPRRTPDASHGRRLGLSWGQYVAGRRVVYALAELDAWAASRTFTSTSEVDEARK